MPWLLGSFLLLLLQPLEPPRFDKLGPGEVEVSVSWPLLPQPAPQLGPMAAEVGEEWLRICLVRPDSGKLGPPLLGQYRREKERLIFHPRVRLEVGQVYRAIAGKEAGPVLLREFRPVPRPTSKEPARVVKVYPTAAVLPANHLRFHIYFSQPMRGGREIFQQIQILDEKGHPISDTWLRDELWDENDQYLILYIHPGRIKYGLLMRETLGPVLVEGRRYTLLLRQDLLDAENRRLQREQRYEFRAGPEVRTRIELRDWQLSTPAVGSLQPLQVHFTRTIDHRSAEKWLQVVDEQGKALAGTAVVGPEEKSWSFTPAQPWRPGSYRVQVHPRLEDSAGNTPSRAFDRDLTVSVLPPQEMALRFQVK